MASTPPRLRRFGRLLAGCVTDDAGLTLPPCPQRRKRSYRPHLLDAHLLDNRRHGAAGHHGFAARAQRGQCGRPVDLPRPLRKPWRHADRCRGLLIGHRHAEPQWSSQPQLGFPRCLHPDLHPGNQSCAGCERQPRGLYPRGAGSRFSPGRALRAAARPLRPPVKTHDPCPGTGGRPSVVDLASHFLDRFRLTVTPWSSRWRRRR